MWDNLQISVKTRIKFAIGFAITGFVIGAVLCAYTFYVTSSHNKGASFSSLSLTLYLLACPPSIGAMALDNAGIVGGLIGWLLISLMNASLYGILGLGFGIKVEKGAI
jgi:hypothetical protein